MTPSDLFELVKIFGPALAAYVSVKVGLAVALERADRALEDAERAHQRIDKLQERRS